MSLMELCCGLMIDFLFVICEDIGVVCVLSDIGWILGELGMGCFFLGWMEGGFLFFLLVVW